MYVAVFVTHFEQRLKTFFSGGGTLILALTHIQINDHNTDSHAYKVETPSIIIEVLVLCVF